MSGETINLVSVKDPEFGAKGDGKTDDTAAIQKALDKVWTTWGVGTVYLPSGTYLIRSTLDVPGAVTLQGAGGRAPGPPLSSDHTVKCTVILKDRTITPDQRGVVTGSEFDAIAIGSRSEVCDLQVEGSMQSEQTFGSGGDGIVVVGGATVRNVVVCHQAGVGIRIGVKGHTGPVTSAHYSADGNLIVTASVADKTARVSVAPGGFRVCELTGHTAGIHSARFSPDGQFIISASVDKTARVWQRGELKPDAVSLQIRRFVSDKELVGHEGAVIAAEYSSDSKLILTVSDDKTVRLWDAASGKMLQTLRHQGAIASARFSRDGARVVTASEDVVQVWDASDGQLRATLKQHTDRVLVAEFSPDGRRVVSASADKTVLVWDDFEGADPKVITLAGHTKDVTSARFLPDSKRVVSTSADTSVRLWVDIEAQPPKVITLAGHADRVTNVQLSPNGRWFVTVSDDKTARVWDATSGNPVARLEGHREAVLGAEFSPDNKYVLTAGADASVRLWNIERGFALERAIPYSNTNFWRLEYVETGFNGSHGIFIHHAGGWWADANVGLATSVASKWNGGDGLRIGNAFCNQFFGLFCAENHGFGIHLFGRHLTGNPVIDGLLETNNATGNSFWMPYLEANDQARDPDLAKGPHETLEDWLVRKSEPQGTELRFGPLSAHNVVFGIRSCTRGGYVDRGQLNFVLDRPNSSGRWHLDVGRPDGSLEPWAARYLVKCKLVLVPGTTEVYDLVPRTIDIAQPTGKVALQMEKGPGTPAEVAWKLIDPTSNSDRPIQEGVLRETTTTPDFASPRPGAYRLVFTLDGKELARASVVVQPRCGIEVENIGISDVANAQSLNKAGSLWVARMRTDGQSLQIHSHLPYVDASAYPAVMPTVRITSQTGPYLNTPVRLVVGGPIMQAVTAGGAPLDTAQAREALMALRPVEYPGVWQWGDTDKHIGLKATETEPLPALLRRTVRPDALPSEPTAVGLMDVIGVLTTVVQDQQRQLEMLRLRLGKRELDEEMSGG